MGKRIQYMSVGVNSRFSNIYKSGDVNIGLYRSVKYMYLFLVLYVHVDVTTYWESPAHVVCPSSYATPCAQLPRTFTVHYLLGYL